MKSIEDFNLEEINTKELQSIVGGKDVAPILIGGILIGAA